MDTDYILEGLFKWTHELVIVDSMGEPVTVQDPKTGKQLPVKVYQRIVGDAEVSMARETALRASALKRTELRDPTNLDRILLVPDFERLERDNLISLALLSEVAEIRDMARRDIRFPFPEEPGIDAALEQQEEYQRLVDTYIERRDEVIKKKAQELLQLRQRELEAMNRQQIERIYEESVINNAARQEMLGTFNEMVTFLATYSDNKFQRRAFTSFSAFRNANSDVKRQLVEGYLNLELQGDKLKK